MKQNILQVPQMKLRMNSFLQQSIQILQLSNTELLDYIHSEAEDNPIIEEIEDVFPTQVIDPSHAEIQSIGEINASTSTMYDNLLNQVNVLQLKKKLIPVIEYGIYSLDENGFLDADLEIWAHACNVSVDIVTDALSIIQSLDPIGLGAKNYKESLILQMQNFGYEDDFLNSLIVENLEWVASFDIKKIAEEYNISVQYAEEILSMIKICHPRPGQLINNKKSIFIIPEASIVKENNSWKLKMHKSNAPKIRINQYYKKFKTTDLETNAYLKNKKEKVNNLNKAIHYRYETLEIILKKMIEIQLMFFEEGRRGLKTLTLKDLSEELGLHTSTISRAIANKYIETPYGIIPIKTLLQSGVQQVGKAAESSSTIKDNIIKIISSEDERYPLSDEKIKKILYDSYNIKIARRTIMKYREQLNIPSSNKRKLRQHTL